MITLENSRIVKLLNDKEEIVLAIRKVARDIEIDENKIKRLEDKEKAITAKVKAPEDLEAKGNALTKEINDNIEQLDAIAKKIEDAKLAAIPEQMKNDHLALLKGKEEKEREINKLALKVQKIKDKVAPIIKKEVTPLLTNEYDDIETVAVVDGKLVIKTFNHVEDFKSKFRKR